MACIISGLINLLGFGLLYISVLGVIPASTLSIAVIGFILGQGSIYLYMIALLRGLEVVPEAYKGTGLSLLNTSFGLSAIWLTCLYQFLGDPIAALSSYFALAGLILVAVSFTSGVLLRKKELTRMVAARTLSNPIFQSWTKPFYLFSAIAFLATGPILVYTNDVGSIVASFGGTSDAESLHTLLFLIVSFAGRSVSGIISDISLNRFKRNRFDGFLLLASLISAIFPVLFIFEDLVLLLSTVCIGLVNGINGAITPLVTLEFFGSEGFSYNWGAIMIMMPIGSFGIQAVAGRIYDSHSNDMHLCFGSVCYHTTLLLCMISALLALLLAVCFRLIFKDNRQKPSTEFLPLLP